MPAVAVTAPVRVDKPPTAKSSAMLTSPAVVRVPCTSTVPCADTAADAVSTPPTLAAAPTVSDCPMCTDFCTATPPVVLMLADVAAPVASVLSCTTTAPMSLDVPATDRSLDEMRLPVPRV